MRSEGAKKKKKKSEKLMNGRNSSSQLEVFIRRLGTNFLYLGETRTKNDNLLAKEGGGGRDEGKLY